MTARSAGRAIVTSPTSAECQAPHSQALTSTPVKPSQAAVSSLWNDSRRISPSPTTGRPISSCMARTSRTARSSAAFNPAGVSSPRA